MWYRYEPKRRVDGNGLVDSAIVEKQSDAKWERRLESVGDAEWRRLKQYGEGYVGCGAMSARALQMRDDNEI